MLSQLDQQQLHQLKGVQQKKYEYKKVKDRFMDNQMTLKQELNKLEVIASIYNSEQYQRLLLSTQENFQDFQTFKKRQDNIPKIDRQRLEKLKLSNENLAYMVEDLERQLQKQLIKSNDINQNMKTSEQSIDQLIAKRRTIQRQIQETKGNLQTIQVRNKLIRAQLSSLISLLTEEDAQLLLKERYQEFIYKFSKHISYNNKAKMHILTDLANKCIVYQSIKNAYEENNQKYTEGCLNQKLQALIIQENQIKQSIQSTKRSIQIEIAADEVLKARDIRKEAIVEARAHVFSKLQDFSKKKSAVAALLQLFVPGSCPELQLERNQIEKELFFLEQQQKKLIDFLNS